MLPYIGIDLVSIPRVRDMIDTSFDATVGRMLRSNELAACHRAGRLDAVSVAGKLAIKEAVFKVFRSRGDPLPWTDIQVQAEEGAAPSVSLDGRARALANAARIGDDISISLTHERDYAIAVAVAFCSSNRLVTNQP